MKKSDSKQPTRGDKAVVQARRKLLESEWLEFIKAAEFENLSSAEEERLRTAFISGARSYCALFLCACESLPPRAERERVVTPKSALAALEKDLVERPDFDLDQWEAACTRDMREALTHAGAMDCLGWPAQIGHFVRFHGWNTIDELLRMGGVYLHVEPSIEFRNPVIRLSGMGRLLAERFDRKAAEKTKRTKKDTRKKWFLESAS